MLGNFLMLTQPNCILGKDALSFPWRTGQIWEVMCGTGIRVRLHQEKWYL